jgi:hypothetical protein
MFWLKNAGVFTLTRFLNNSYIFPFSSHLTIIFIYRDTFVSSIVLCTLYIIVLPSFDDAPDLCGVVDAGAYELHSFIFLPTPRGLNNMLPTPRQRHFLISGDSLAFLSLCLLSQMTSLGFFLVVS